MAAPEEYLLRFDFEKLRSQVEGARRTYTDFGLSLHDLIESTSSEMSTLQQKATAVSGSLAALGPQLDRSSQSIRLGMGSTSGMLESMSQYGEKIANDMTRLSGIKLRKADTEGMSPSLTKAMSKLEVARETARVADDAADSAKERGDLTSKKIKAADMKSAQEVGRLKAYLVTEMDSAKSQVKGVMSHVPGGVLAAGGVMGGLIAAMVLGYTERDRLRAQSGEVLNVFEATGEALSTTASKRTRKFFSSFQETAQWYYGVTKAETQGVLKTMVDAGYRSKDFMIEYDRTLGIVGKNVTVASIAADKHFNQQTGTSIGNITKITTELGDSLGTATDKYIKLAFAGQRSGMGVSRFVDSVISGASAMQQYGVDVANVASVMGTIQKHYKDMGLDPRYAGGQAQQVMSGMAQGLTSLSPSMKAVLAKQMFPELDALDALQKWEDGFLRAGKEGGNDFMQRAFVEFRKWASAGGRGRSQTIRIMEYQGVDNRTAATVYDLAGKIEKTNNLKSLSKEELKRLRETFQTEGQRVSSLHKTQRRLYEAIKEIGTGLLKVLVGLIGTIALGVKSLPIIVSLALTRPDNMKSEFEKMGAHFNALQSHMGVGVDDIIRGTGMLPGIFGKEFGNTFKPLTDVLLYQPDVKGGAGIPTSISAAKKLVKELGSNISDLFTDEDFRRQLHEKMMADSLRFMAFQMEMLPQAASPEEAAARDRTKEWLTTKATAVDAYHENRGVREARAKREAAAKARKSRAGVQGPGAPQVVLPASSTAVVDSRAVITANLATKSKTSEHL